ncbi:hypothetical protein [uncultured Anaerococcus sp.]|uniref:hypothetical protein n=1 Tax=uncultured Anaerococcus sp. TaxID=293428 RepID=UPI00288B8345|nr:hypothetical protein [uncultured Anaerococcus sp.]
MNEQIIQKYVNLTSQKIYDSFYLETQLEEANKRIAEDEKEIERLKNILDKNEISYEEEKELGDETRDE